MLFKPGLAFLAAFSIFAAPRDARAVQVGDHVPCTTLRDVQPDGTEFTHCINDRPPGIRYIVLEFFSITCGDCLHSLPIFHRLTTEISDRAQTRQIAVDRSEEAIRRFLRQGSANINFPVAMDLERVAKNDYGIATTPTFLVLDETDTVVYVHADTALGTAETDAIKTIIGL